jgi:uncharacterized protein YdhG (YjbR/CyaY superfamily)
MAAQPTSVDGYLAALPEGARATLQGLRRTIQAVAPEAVAVISYGMPTLKYRGRPLVYFAAWKTHCALYGLKPDAHAEELKAYDVAKGTIRFPIGQPLPEPLLRSLVGARLAEIEAAAPPGRPRRKSAERSD